jgi:hypothetical protein
MSDSQKCRINQIIGPVLDIVFRKVKFQTFTTHLLLLQNAAQPCEVQQL